MPETVTISKEEYGRLKRLEAIEIEIIDDFKKSLADLCAGRLRRRA